MDKDKEQLRLLAVFHFIVGGLIALFACIPFIHLILGIVMIVAPGSMQSSGQPPPTIVGWAFVLIGGLIILMGWILAGCVIAAGRCLVKQRRYLYCLVVAGLLCLFMPFGTILGVLTIIVLVRESVKKLFTDGTPPQAETAAAPPPLN